MPTAEKEALVQDMTGRLKGVKGMYLADFTGLTVEKASLLRAKCREAGVEYKVIKNTLLKRAIHAHDIKQLDEFLEGPTALAFSTVKPVKSARYMPFTPLRRSDTSWTRASFSAVGIVFSSPRA